MLSIEGIVLYNEFVGSYNIVGEDWQSFDVVKPGFGVSMQWPAMGFVLVEPETQELIIFIESSNRWVIPSGAGAHRSFMLREDEVTQEIVFHVYDFEHQHYQTLRWNP